MKLYAVVSFKKSKHNAEVFLLGVTAYEDEAKKIALENERDGDSSLSDDFSQQSEVCEFVLEGRLFEAIRAELCK